MVLIRVFEVTVFILVGDTTFVLERAYTTSSATSPAKPALGEAEGDFDGEALGDFDGDFEGDIDGDSLALGDNEGLPDGDSEADGDNEADGEILGLSEGLSLADGLSEGLPEGDSLGLSEGDPLGLLDGEALGDSEIPAFSLKETFTSSILKNESPSLPSKALKYRVAMPAPIVPPLSTA